MTPDDLIEENTFEYLSLKDAITEAEEAVSDAKNDLKMAEEELEFFEKENEGYFIR